MRQRRDRGPGQGGHELQRRPGRGRHPARRRHHRALPHREGRQPYARQRLRRAVPEADGTGGLRHTRALRHLHASLPRRLGGVDEPAARLRRRALRVVPAEDDPARGIHGDRALGVRPALALQPAVLLVLQGIPAGPDLPHQRLQVRGHQLQRRGRRRGARRTRSRGQAVHL